MFTPFTKIKDNRQYNRDGVGLGLVISRNIAKALGRDIEVEYEIEKGSNFRLLVPLRREMEDDIYVKSRVSLNSITDRNSMCEDMDPTFKSDNFCRAPQMLKLRQQIKHPCLLTNASYKSNEKFMNDSGLDGM